MATSKHKHGEPSLKDFLQEQKVVKTELAAQLNVTPKTINTWEELNAIPPSRITKVAVALQVAPGDLFPYMKRAYKPVKSSVKNGYDDLVAINNAYYKKPYSTTLSQKAVNSILRAWGDRWPSIFETLTRLHTKEIGPTEAAGILNLSVSTIHGLRRRYGLNPGPLKAEKKPPKQKEITKVQAKKLSLDVISGRKTVIQAAKETGMSLRTLHRHLAVYLRPQMLNEISHWSLNFRQTLAHEVDRGSVRRSVSLREWAKTRNLTLNKKPKWPKLPKSREGWRTLSARQVAILILSGQTSIDELAEERGASPSVIGDIIRSQVKPLGETAPLTLQVAHQAALAEVLIALEVPLQNGETYV